MKEFGYVAECDKRLYKYELESGPFREVREVAKHSVDFTRSYIRSWCCTDIGK